MGSWNKTCALTGLAICSDMPIYGFVIIESPYHNRDGATALWTPVLLPFTGKYNSYGEASNCSDELNQVIDELRPHVVARKQGKNKYHQRAVCPDTMGIPHVFNAVADNRLLLTDKYSGKRVLVDFVLMRQDCVQHLLQSWKRETYRKQGETRCQYTHNDLVAQLDTFLSHTPSDHTRFHLNVRNLIDNIRCDNTDIMLVELCEYLGALFNDYSINKHIKSLNFFEKSYSYGRARHVLEQLLIGITVHSFFCNARKIWTPMCHEGSQATAWAEHELLANIVIDTVKHDKRATEYYVEEYEE